MIRLFRKFLQFLSNIEVFITRGIGDGFLCCAIWALFMARLLEIKLVA